MENVDEIWKKASERFPTSTTAWLKNFAGDVSRAKRAIVDTLKGAGGNGPGKKILRRKLDNVDSSGSDSGSSETEADEAVALLKLMAEQPHMTALVSAYLRESRSEEGNLPSRENHVLHVAAKSGSIGELRRIIKKGHVDVLNRDEETPLHLAAEFEHVEDVSILLRLGATIRADKHGCTPLHSSAMAITPSDKIAGLLVQAATVRGDNFRLLNEQSSTESGQNTALHVAAGNVNVTAEFIEELKDTDPRIQNAESDTAFHVAAKSSNANVIIYLLTTFRPTNAGWDIDSVDENRDDKAPTLLNMCAGNGNAEAVALLIQHGAEVANGVLHEIVIASVKKPELMERFLAVYEAVVDNVVTWRCLRDNRKCMIRGSSEYNEVLRETMIYLTTKPYRDGKNMIQRAIKLGASEMLMAILNTDNVYKFDHFGARRNDRLQMQCFHSRYDITDFARPSCVQHSVESKTTVENPAVTELAFTQRHPPKVPYLEELLLHNDDWKNKNVLAMQPLRKLTKPYFGFVQRYYLILGLIQLTFMSFLSAFYIPDTCTMAGMFNGSGCKISSSDGSQASDKTNSTQVNSRELPNGLWLVWPVIILIGSTAEFVIKYLWSDAVHLSQYTRNSFSHDHAELKVLRRRNIAVWPTKLLLNFTTSFPLLAFCISVFVWFHRHAYCDDRKLYLEALAMVFLFGWMVAFILFSRIAERLSVFLIVLNGIIVEDILMSFILVFVCTIVGFSLALHALRLKSETAPDVLVRHSVYDVFITALGIGSFFEETRTDMDNSMGLFRIVFAFYVCFTSIILLNVLIAMLSSRYEDAKKRAEGVWRFEVIKTALILEDFNIFSKYLATAKCYFLCCFFSDIYEDEDIKKSGRRFVDVRLKVEDDD